MKHEFVKLYENGNGSTTISRRFNVSIYTVLKILKENGIQIRGDKEKNKKIKFNENYFRKIDCSNKAYFLGLMAADGQIQNNKQHSLLMRIDLQEEDKYILEKFAIELGFSKERIVIYNRKFPNKNVSRLIVHSDNLCNDLSKYNIVPRKTFTYTWPNKLPKIYSKDFLRGYFDGDGCITVGPCVKIVGTESLLLSIQDLLFLECDITKTKLQKRHKERIDNIYNLENGGRKKIEKIYHYLYDGSETFLIRKRDKFLMFIGANNDKADI